MDPRGSAPPLHPWNLSLREARSWQIALRGRLILEWSGAPPRSVAGIDVHYEKGLGRAAIVVLSYPGLALCHEEILQGEVPFPYIPGLLAFREGPLVLGVCRRLPSLPDVLLFDGHGVAHPLGFGLASHLGLWMDRPSIGVAKSRLYGRYQPPGPDFGDVSVLQDEHSPEVLVGAVVRTRAGAKPVFVSPGHRMSLDDAIGITLACCRGHRLPEPLWLADRLARRPVG